MSTRQRIIGTLVVAVIISILNSISFNDAHSYSTGAPQGKTNSPADGSNCTSCHSGAATAQTGWITSTVPVTGYIPGTTYTFTATATKTACVKFGFEISPQNTSGTLLGTLIATNTTETQLINSGKYITHTSSGTSAVGGTKSWSFDWIAPATNIGAVTFYGSFNGSNNNGSSSGDAIYTTTLVVPACTVLAAPGLISGNQTPCVGSTPSYSIATVSGATSYTWTTPSGWLGTSIDTSINTTVGAASGNVTVSATNACGTSTPQLLSVTASQIASISITKTNVSCNSGTNGNATATPAGGTAPYIYSWNTLPIKTTATATGLAAGVYNVTVTDANGCSKTMSVTITQPTVLSATASKTNVLCNGGNTGTATANATGGTGSYTYSWNTTPVQTTATATNLPIGTYTCNISDANGCTATAAATIAQPSVLSGSTSQVNVLCKGDNSGSATALPSGGISSYTYSWNTLPVQTTATAINLAVGTYTVTIKDANNCTTTAQATITEPITALTTASNVVSNVLCNGGTTGSASVAATGGTGAYTYSWNTIPVQSTATASNLAAGTYIATVTDASGCKNTDTAVVTQPTVLLPNMTPSPAYCNGVADGTASAENPGGTPPYTFSWNSSPVQTTSFATNLPAGTYTVTVTDSNNCTVTASTTVTQPTAIVATTTTTNVLCKNGASGSATVMATGGTAPYTYSWNTSPIQITNTATNLAAGTHTVTVKDVNNCVLTTQVTVTEPATAVTVSASATASTCGAPTGTLTATASGGTGALTYSWNTSPVQTTANATAVPSGVYTITATDTNNCAGTATATVVNPAGATATISSTTNVLCNGGATGAATVAVTGGTMPYIYSWNTLPIKTTSSITNVLAGTYTVTVTDGNNCVTTANTIITQTAAISGNVTKQNVLCNGNATGSAVITGTGGTSPYTYSWNTSPAQITNTATNLPAGNYICTITDANNCVGNKSTTITQSTPIVITTTQTNATCAVCTDGDASAIVSGGATPYSYSWNTNPVRTTPTITGLALGKYLITIIDGNGCTRKDSVTLSVITGRINISNAIQYSVYPNPTESSLTVNAVLEHTSPIKVYITTLAGETLLYYTQENTKLINHTFDMTTIAAGVYFVIIQTNTSKIVNRIVKQ